MISYAQNAEDVVLARALPAATGFYVDVGAADPNIASVTRHFYDLGWSGINVDARVEAVTLLALHRPRDVNLHLAAYSSDGVVTFHEDADDPDQSTTEFTNAEVLRSSGHHLQTGQVQARTLNGILAEHVPAGTGIDFLKIDVEGAELAVLEGIDLTRWRPKIIVVEAVRPWSTERTDQHWRHHLDDNGYIESLFDGLNLFFTAQEHAADIDPLPPASIVDRYTPAYVELLNEEITRLRDYVRSLLGELGHTSADADSQAAADPPPEPARGFLVIGPIEATTPLARRLAATLNTTPRRVDHPADVDWDGLAEQEVVQLNWPPTRHLLHLAHSHHLQPVVPDSAGEDPSVRSDGTRTDHRPAWRQRPGTLTENDLSPDRSAPVDRT